MIVKARRQSPTGDRSTTLPISPAGGYAWGMRMDVEPDRDAIVVWSRRIGDTGNHVIEARRRAASGALSATYTLSEVTGYSYVPDVAVTPDGRATVAWLRTGPEPQGNPYVQTRTIAADGSLSATQDLSPTTYNAGRPRVAVSDAGVATIGWTSLESSGPAYYRVRAADGKLSAPVPIADDVAELSIDGNGAGRTVFAWIEAVNDWYYDAKARVRAPGGPLYAPFDVGGKEEQQSLKVAMDPEGNTTFAWVQREDWGTPTIKLRRRNLAGAMGPVRSPAQPDLWTGEPFLAVDGAGKATVAWSIEQDDVDPNAVFTRTMTADATLSPAVQRVDE